MGKAKAGLLVIILVVIVAGVWLFLQNQKQEADKNFLNEYPSLSESWKSEGFSEDYLTNNFPELFAQPDSKITEISQNIEYFNAKNQGISEVKSIYLQYIELVAGLKELNQLQKSSESIDDSCLKIPALKQVNAKTKGLLQEALSFQEKTNSFIEESPNLALSINLNKAYFDQNFITSFVSDSSDFINFLEDGCK